MIDILEISFCKTNLDLYSEDLEAELRSKGFLTEERQCLGYCGDCMCGAIALIDNIFCEEEEIEQLLNKTEEEVS